MQEDRLVDAPFPEPCQDLLGSIAAFDARPCVVFREALIALQGTGRKLREHVLHNLQSHTPRRELLGKLALAVLAPGEEPQGRAFGLFPRIRQALTSSTAGPFSAAAGNTLARTSRSISAARSGWSLRKPRTFSLP